MKTSINSSPWSGVIVFITLNVVSGFNIISSPKLLAKPCYSSLRMEPGICVSTWECIKADGKRLGICANGFLFGVCCGTKELERTTSTTTTTTTTTTTSTSTTTTTPRPLSISTTVRPFVNPTSGSVVRFPPVKTQSPVTPCDSCTSSSTTPPFEPVAANNATAAPFTVTSSNLISFPGTGLKGSIKNGTGALNEITPTATPVVVKWSTFRPGTSSLPTVGVSTSSNSHHHDSPSSSSAPATQEGSSSSLAMAQSSTPSPSSTTSSTSSNSEGEAVISTTATNSTPSVPSSPSPSSGSSSTTQTSLPPSSSSSSSPSPSPSSTVSGSNATSTTSSPSAQITNSAICGRRRLGSRKAARIVGGTQSKFLEWPWMVSLRQWKKSSFQHKCGAALLNNFWAITAAHCVENVASTDLLLRLGEYDISHENEPYPYVERRVHVVAPHPQFDPRTFEYDLALLRLYEPVHYTPNILPICVPSGNDSYVGKSATVTGWGRLHEDGPLPDILQHVEVPVMTNKECESMYRRAGYIEEIPNIFICAGLSKGQKDSCEGDSGGPLVIENKGRWELIGVISWGIGCALPNQPGVYTRITEFSNWINQIIEFYR